MQPVQTGIGQKALGEPVASERLRGDLDNWQRFGGDYMST